MRIEIDKNHLLTIFNENIPQIKEYTYSVGGYLFSDFDKWIIVLHKKEWKIISLKNLGDTMSVAYVKKWSLETRNWELEISKAMKLFQWFDEEIGKKYYFIPWFWEIHQQEKNNILKKLWTGYSIDKTAKWMIIQSKWNEVPQGGRTESENNKEDILGYIFGLMIIYGKWEGKKWELTSIKIQIPLAWQYLAHQENLDIIIKKLYEKGIFLKVDKLTNKNGITYQISSNDFELLEIFAHWYEAVEKFEKITKRDFTDEMKIKLLEFIQTNPEIPQDGKAEVLKQIQEWTIKLLTK